MLGLSPVIKILNFVKSGHGTFVLSDIDVTSIKLPLNKKINMTLNVCSK